MPVRIKVRVRFYGALNDFLGPKQKGRWVERRLNGHPSIGDTAESLGVPHPEIAKVILNGKPAPLSRQLRWHLSSGQFLPLRCLRAMQRGRLLPPLPRRQGEGYLLPRPPKRRPDGWQISQIP